ncbi:MAG: phage portal protein [Candidatus Pristimantibacillus sp.]
MQKDMSFFMKGKAAQLPEEDVVVSKRFKDNEGNPIPFKLKALPTARIEEIQEDCTKSIIKKGRVVEKKLDQQRFVARMGIESTVYPEFRDADLLASYGVNDPVILVKQILSLAGEYAEWIAAVQRVNGFEEDFDDLVEEAKN